MKVGITQRQLITLRTRILYGTDGTPEFQKWQTEVAFPSEAVRKVLEGLSMKDATKLIRMTTKGEWGQIIQTINQRIAAKEVSI